MMIYEDILRDFQKTKVKYVLVGGIAFNLHGAVRNTADLDILVEMSDKNLEKIVTILKRRGYQVRQPVDPMNIAVPEIRNEWIEKKHMKAFNFYKDRDLKEVDIIIDSPVSYESAVKDCVLVKAGNLSIFLISLEHLIKMKKKTGRTIDRQDVAALKQIQKMRKKK